MLRLEKREGKFSFNREEKRTKRKGDPLAEEAGSFLSPRRVCRGA